MPLQNLCALKEESFPPKSTFSVEDIPDLTGKVMLVTGGNAGIGRETCKELLKKNAKVYLAARDAKKAEKVIAELEQETGHRAEFLLLDLGNLEAIKQSAEDFKRRESVLHVLFNNAGVMTPPIDQFTADGFDLQFGTNVVGPYLFTRLLIPVLLAGARESPEKYARVVNTSSSARLFVDEIKYETLRGDTRARKSFGTQNLYAQSKLANVFFAEELARRYGGQGIVSTSLNPGNIRSDLQRHLSGVQEKVIGMLLHPTPFGALTQLWAGTSPETAGFNGKYLIPWARLGTNPIYAETPAKIQQGVELWDWLESEVKAYL